MSEPACGSDVSAIKSKAVPDGDEYVLDGQKMWLTNGARAGIIATPGQDRRGRRLGLQEHDDLPRREGARLRPDGARGSPSPARSTRWATRASRPPRWSWRAPACPASTILGGEEGRGKGFYQMMDGVEVGRVNVAARACGISIRAFELAIQYAQQRSTFGKPIAQHQAIQFKLAEMATKVEAAHALMVNAARLKDAGKRNDVEAGMAKLLASEYCAEVTQESFRIHGGYGYSKEYEIERLMREAPFLLIGEGTSEIQKTIISRGLLKDYKLKG
jgi:alkylation response protein AidB-like acyl-CoA dehydrogenase